jgi:preprotein translocase subunit SecG
MYLLISVLIIIASILLILIVLVQNSKGGGLASNFASSNQVMGVRKTADFLEKATWTLAISLLVLSLLASFAIPRDKGEVSRSAIEEQLDKTPSPSALPSFPTPTPDENGDGEKPEEN